MFNKVSVKKLLVASSIFASSLLMATTVPNAPGDYVGVWNVTPTSARISIIDNSSNEDGFKVYIYNNTDGVLDTSLSPNPIIVPKNDDGSIYQYVDLTNLEPNEFYEVRVTAFNEAGESASTNPSSENGGRFTTQEVCTPEMPGEYVGVYNITTDGARISFKDNSDDEDGFKVYVYKYDTNELVKTIDLDQTAVVNGYVYTNIDGLEANTFYKVAVTAYNSCGESKATVASSETNGWFRTEQNPCPAMPNEYVGVYNVTEDSARISFLDNAFNEVGFRVYVTDYETGEYVKIINVPAKEGVGSYQYADITGLESDRVYLVAVSAYNCECESEKTSASSETNGQFRTK